MSDLPTIGAIVRGLAHINMTEAIGPGPTSEIAIAEVKLSARDMHSATSDFEFIKPNSNGLPVYTYERWIRFHFTPPFGRVTNFRLWSSNLDLNAGWTLTFGSSQVYATPIQQRSTYAITPLPTVDPGTPNILGAVAGPDGSSFSPWIVFQALASGASPGAMQDNPLALELGWTES